MKGGARFDVELMMRLRAGKGWTLRDLEKHTGLSNAFLSQIQTGRSWTAPRS